MDKTTSHQKVIYLIPSPFFQRDFHRYGCEYLMNCGYDVEIWYIPLDGNPEFETQAGMYNGRNLLLLSEKAYSRRVKMNLNGLFISLHFRVEIMIPIVKNKCKYILYGGFGRVVPYASLRNTDNNLLNVNQNPFFSFLSQMKKEGACTVAKKRLQKYHGRIYEKKYNQIISSNPPSAIITSVLPCLYESFRKEEIEKSKNNVIVHSYDYDRFIETNRSDNSDEQNCIVYLDSGIYLLSYDAMREGVYEDVRAHMDEYFQQTNRLFDRLSEHYGLPVVIAGHPHVLYPENAYDGRDIIFNDTCSLVKHAKIVITTDTTAVSFVALYDKPLLRIYNKRIHTEIGYGYGVYWDDYIKYKADEIEGTGILNLDNDEDMLHPWDFVRRFDSEKREKYIKEYLIDSNIENETTYEVLEKEIKRIEC